MGFNVYGCCVELDLWIQLRYIQLKMHTESVDYLHVAQRTS